MPKKKSNLSANRPTTRPTKTMKAGKRRPTSRPRGRPPKQMTGPELLRRFGDRTLVWCDEHGNVAADQTQPTEYVRALTKTEEFEAQVAEVDAILSANPEFERCDPKGASDSKGDRWKLRDEVYHGTQGA
jgi:hypothetical protein